MFGCSDGGQRYQFHDELTDHVANARARDRLTHMDVLDQEYLGQVWEHRQVSRRTLFKGAGALALASAAGPLFAASGAAESDGGSEGEEHDGGGKDVVIPSIPDETVHIGQFRMDVPDVATVDSGDVLVYPNTFTHFMNALQPGLTIRQIAQLRLDNPGRGPHSIIGPVAVKGAVPGDLLEVRFLKLDPIDFGVNFHNPLLPGIRTGALPDEFPDGQVVYFELDRKKMRTKFRDHIHIPLAPFQGTFGLAPRGVEPAVSSVPPGQHAGNIDLRELTAGSTLWIPVWRAGARIYTGDTHVAQGDGEINLTAIESAMREVRAQVILHKGALNAVAEDERWPSGETKTHWIPLGTASPTPDQAAAFRNAFLRALHNAITFLHVRAGLTRDDAYALCSMAVSFRITQVVDVNIGVHAMIPKALFDEDRRRDIGVA
jgi:acetamidase/formamidase